MWKYYKDISWGAFKRILSKGPIIVGIFKIIIIFGLPLFIGSLAVDNLWTWNGFIENWYWVVGPLFLVVSIFWFWELLTINFTNVEVTRPQLVVDYREGENSYQQWDPEEDNPIWRLHRIRIFNKGQRPAKDIFVQLNDISPIPGNNVRGLPIKLRVMGRDEEPLCYDPIFNLSGQTEEFVDVISLSQRGCEGETLLFSVGSKNAQRIWLRDNKNYEIKITVIADGAKYCEKTFQLIPSDKSSFPTNHRFIEAVIDTNAGSAG